MGGRGATPGEGFGGPWSVLGQKDNYAGGDSSVVNLRLLYRPGFVRPYPMKRGA